MYSFTPNSEDFDSVSSSSIRNDFSQLITQVKGYGIFSINAEGIVQSWNDGATIVQGYHAEETIGNSFAPCYESEVEKPEGYFNELLSNARKFGQFEEEGWRKRKDGVYYWSSILITPIYDENENLSAYTLISRDISQKKLTAEITEISEIAIANHDALVLATSNITWNRSFDGQFYAPNLQWEHFTGQIWPEYGGYGWMKMHPKEEHDKIKLFWEELQTLNLKELKKDWKILQKGEISEKLILKTKLWSKLHREYRYIMLSVVPIFHAADTVQEWLGNEKDVHKIRLLENEQREMIQKQNIMLESARIGLWQLDLLSNDIQIDQNTANFFGIAFIHSIHKLSDILEHVHFDDRQLLRNFVKKCIEVKESKQVEFRALWPDGSTHYIVWHGKIHHDAQHQPNYLIGAGWDITETRMLLEERARAESAEKQKREMAEFVDCVCHELRNPLHGISGYLTELQDVLESLNQVLIPKQFREMKMEQFVGSINKLKKSLQVIEGCTTHQHKVIKQLSEMSQIELNRTILASDSFVVQPVITSVLLMHELVCKNNNITLKCDIVGEDMFIKSDKTRFTQIIMNMVSSVLDNVSVNGAASLRVTICDKKSSTITFEIVVEVEGTCFTPEQISNQLERYIPVSDHGSAKYESNTLGLAMCKSLTQLLGGSFEFVTNGKNTNIYRLKFTMELGEKSASNSTSTSTTDTLQISAKMIMIVDDNPTNRKVLRRVLEKKGYCCVEAEDGQKAIECFQNTRPDFIFMDLQMPHKDGFEATAVIRALDAFVPIFALSGYERSQYRTRATAVGMQGYIVKPFNLPEIHKVLQQYLS